MASEPVEPLKSPKMDGANARKNRVKRQQGFIKLSAMFNEKAGDLVVHVGEARDLRGTKCSPYCKMYLLPDKAKKTKKKTSARKHTPNPKWDEEIRWLLPDFKVGPCPVAMEKWRAKTY